MIANRPAWDGRTVVCIASGPSLTAEDCELVREAGHPVVVTNTTFRLCPWADVLFAYDLKWWVHFHEEVYRDFPGRKMTGSLVAAKYAETLAGATWTRNYPNSGVSALAVALGAGARKIVMIGYDASPDPVGKMHWHGDHPKALSNASSIRSWPQKFENVAKEAKLKGVEILNASRRTALTCFPRDSLTAAL